jgi:hypothetical protein
VAAQRRDERSRHASGDASGCGSPSVEHAVWARPSPAIARPARPSHPHVVDKQGHRLLTTSSARRGVARNVRCGRRAARPRHAQNGPRSACGAWPRRLLRSLTSACQH